MAVSINQNLNVLSWNATGIMSSSTYLCDTLVQRNIDICGISEHWLYEKDLHFLTKWIAIIEVMPSLMLLLTFREEEGSVKEGLPFCGTKKHDQNIAPLYIDDDRIIGIKYNCMSNFVIYFFQMYLPCSNYSLLTYTEYLDKMRNIMNLYSESGIVVLMGDMNVNLLPNAVQGNATGRKLHFLNFLQDSNMTFLTTLGLCTGARSSFVSYDNSAESLIDHIIFPVEKFLYVNECEICDHDCLNVSRHRPIFCQLRLPAYNLWSSGRESDNNINWKNATAESMLIYIQCLSNDISLRNLANNEINSEMDINNAYSTIVTVVKKTAVECLPTKKIQTFFKTILE